MKIKYWSDYNCPYCYIANTRLKKAINELNLKNVEFEIHSFELNPEAPKDVESTTLERFAIKYNITLKEAEQEINNITLMGQDEGIDFKYASTLFTNSRDAHRLLKFALDNYDMDIVNNLHEALFKAYFVDNLKLADIDTLVQIAVDNGLDKNEVIDVLESDKYDKEVELDEMMAYQFGIHAVPYYIFEDKFVIPGALSKQDFKNVLLKVAGDDDVDDESDAKQCGNGTCLI